MLEKAGGMVWVWPRECRCWDEGSNNEVNRAQRVRSGKLDLAKIYRFVVGKVSRAPAFYAIPDTPRTRASLGISRFSVGSAGITR